MRNGSTWVLRSQGDWALTIGALLDTASPRGPQAALRFLASLRGLPGFCLPMTRLYFLLVSATYSTCPHWRQAVYKPSSSLCLCTSPWHLGHALRITTSLHLDLQPFPLQTSPSPAPDRGAQASHRPRTVRCVDVTCQALAALLHKIVITPVSLTTTQGTAYTVHSPLLKAAYAFHGGYTPSNSATIAEE